MSRASIHDVDVFDHNRISWNRQVAQQGAWSQYSDLEHLDAGALSDKRQRGEPLVFGHSLGEQIGGQIEAGFVLTGFYEDWQPNPRFVIDRYLPTFLATWASKP